MSETVSHPYRPTSRIIVLCILIFMFLDSRLNEGDFLFGST
jgi:hypothetical protein